MIDQYADDNNDRMPSTMLSNKQSSLVITPVGRTTQLSVGNQAVSVVNPRLVDQLQQQLSQLSHKLVDMETRHQRLQQQHQNLAKLVVTLQSQIKDFS